MLYHGLSILGSGATLAGIILGSVTVLIIDRKLDKAAYFAFAGAVLTFFGLIHSEAIGVFKTPLVAASYLACALFLLVCAKRAQQQDAVLAHAPTIEHGIGEVVEAA